MLEGKVAVVTGSGGGVGREIALHMAQAGAKIIINDIGASLSGEGQSATPAQQTKAIIEQRGGQAEINTDSVSSWDSAGKIVQSALDHFGRIDIVVNNAGILRDQIFHRMSPEEWDSGHRRPPERLLLHVAPRRDAFPQAGKRRLRPHHLDLRPDRQFRPGELFGGEARHRGAVEVDRARHEALQRALQLPRPLRLEPHDLLHPGGDAGAEGAGREDHAHGAGEERAARGVPRLGRGEAR